MLPQLTLDGREESRETQAPAPVVPAVREPLFVVPDPMRGQLVLPARETS